MECKRCGEWIVLAGTGRPPSYCSARCRVAASRARRKNPFPAAMTDRESWTRADGKRPIRPNGKPASSTKRETWSPFAEVQSGAGDGFGIMLGGGLGCYDLDDCFDGDDLKTWAAAILDSETPVYVERSVSGRGLHVFINAPEGPGQKLGNIERYTRDRFIRTTGDTYPKTAIHSHRASIA